MFFGSSSSRIKTRRAISGVSWLSLSVPYRFAQERYVLPSILTALFVCDFRFEWICYCVTLGSNFLPQQETLTMTLASSLFRYSCRSVLSALRQSLSDYFLRRFVSCISFVLDEYNRGDLWLQSVGLRFVFMSLLDDVVTLFEPSFGSSYNALLRIFSCVYRHYYDVSFICGSSFCFESCVVKSSVWYFGWYFVAHLYSTLITTQLMISQVLVVVPFLLFVAVVMMYHSCVALVLNHTTINRRLSSPSWSGYFRWSHSFDVNESEWKCNNHFILLSQCYRIIIHKW